MTTIEDKETQILATVRTNKLAALAIEHKDYIVFDDIFNLTAELSSEIIRLNNRMIKTVALIEEEKDKKDKLDELNGSRVTSAEAAMQGQEVFSKELGKIEWVMKRKEYTLASLKAKKDATIDFYEKHLGKKYVPYSSGVVKNVDKLQQKQVEAKQWLAKNNDKIPAVITQSEIIPAVAE